jgi:DnaK suppressor protein
MLRESPLVVCRRGTQWTGAEPGKVGNLSLTAEQLQHLEDRLREERDRALRILNRSVSEHAGGSEQDQSGDLTSVPFHIADRGTDTMQTELDAANATRVSRELAEIDAALERLYQHPEQFGICQETGAEISYERLELIPWARTCEQVGPVR